MIKKFSKTNNHTLRPNIKLLNPELQLSSIFYGVTKRRQKLSLIPIKTFLTQVTKLIIVADTIIYTLQNKPILLKRSILSYLTRSTHLQTNDNIAKHIIEHLPVVESLHQQDINNNVLNSHLSKRIQPLPIKRIPLRTITD